MVEELNYRWNTCFIRQAQSVTYMTLRIDNKCLWFKVRKGPMSLSYCFIYIFVKTVDSFLRRVWWTWIINIFQLIKIFRPTDQGYVQRVRIESPLDFFQYDFITRNIMRYLENISVFFFLFFLYSIDRYLQCNLLLSYWIKLVYRCLVTPQLIAIISLS